MLTQKKHARKQVAFIINSLAGGGAERVMCTLLRASYDESRTHDITLVLLDREPAAYQPPDWVVVEQLNCRHSLLRSIWSLFWAMRRLRPDATLSFLTRANLANIIAGKLLAIPVLISERVNTSTHLATGRSAALAKWLVKLLYRKSHRVIAVSPGVAEDLTTSFDVPKSQMAVIANPIDVDRIRAESERSTTAAINGPYLMAMGRLVPNKNFEMLVDAMALAKTAEKLVIFGEGPERERLNNRIAELGLQQQVTLAGFSASPFAALRGASMFILPSNAEGFPNSLLEAMSLGVPVISTNCTSGPSEVLADMPREAVGAKVRFAEFGVLVPPDNAAAMAEALRAMTDPARRTAYGLKASIRAEQYSVARAKDLYWAELRTVL